MVPFDRQEVMVVRQRQIGVDTAFEPPLRVGFGISDQTVDLANAVMGDGAAAGRRTESDALPREQ